MSSCGTFTTKVGKSPSKRFQRFLVFLFAITGHLTFSFQNAYAASGITYTGRILKADQPLDSGIVRFDVWVKTKDNCVLYYERRNIDMSGSGGTYSFEIGDANIIPGSQSFPQTGIQTISDIFNNTKSRANGDVDGSLQCSTFNPASDEGRLMTVSFTPQGETAQALPDLAITAVPTAFQAFNANKVNGYGTGDLLKVDPTVTKTTYANTPLSQSQYDEFWKLILGTSTTYLKSIPTLGGDVTGTLPAVTVTKIQNVAVTAPTTGDTGKVLTYNGTGMVWSAAAAGGITTLNGETGTTQSFAVGSGGTDFNISSSSGTHTFNIPSASSSNRGLLTSADWNTFNSKQSSSLGSGQVWIGNASNGAQAQTLSGDATVSASGNVTVDKTQNATGSKILQLDASGNAYVAGVDIKGTGASAKLRFTGSTDMVMNLPTTSGTANQFLQTDGAGNLSWGSQSAMLPTISAGQVWVGNASNGAQAFSLTGDIASVSSTGVVTLSSSATGSNKLPLAGGTMSGAINMGGNNISNAGDVSLAAGKFLGLGVGSTAGTVTGQMWYDSGIIKYFDGTSVQSLGVAGAGITSLNGLTSGTQSFVNGTSGTAPAFSSAGSAHTLNIPMASSATVTAGLISNADYASMMAKQSGSLAAGQVWVGNASGVAQAFSLSGDISSVSNTGSVVVNKTTTGQANYILALDGSGVANVKGLDVQTGTGKVTFLTNGAFTNYTLTLPNASPSANQIMKSDASGNLSWVTYLANVSDSAPLTNGKMWIGNASGIASEVTMSGDATITNAGLLTLKSVGTLGTYTKVVTDAQGRVTSGSALTSGDVTTALGYTPAAPGAGYVNGGNAFTGDATIGLNDNYNLGFKTNNKIQMTITGSGYLGIGTTTPRGNLDVTSPDVAEMFLTSSSGANYTGSGLVLQSLSAAGGSRAMGIFMHDEADQDEWFAGRPFNWIGDNDAYIISRKTSTANHDRSTSEGVLSLLTIKGNGNVGIGNNTPSVSLDLSAKTDALALPKGTTAQQPASAAGLIRYNTSNNVVEYNNGSTWVTVGSSLGYTPVNKAGDTMSGDLNAQNLNVAAGKYLGLGAGSTAGTVAGQMWYDSGVIKYFDGTTTQSLGVAGAGITSLNGLTSNTQSFVIGSSGNSPAFSSAGSAHTLNIPMASASGSVTAGLISNADYASIMAKQSSALGSGQMWVGNASGAAQAFGLSGDIFSVSATGLVTVVKSTTGTANQIVALDGSSIGTMSGVKLPSGAFNVTLTAATTATGSYVLRLPAGAPGANQIMQSDASGNLSWVSNSANVNNAASLTNGKMWLGNSGNVAVEVAMSGDATISNAGLLSLKATGTAGTYWKVVTDAQGRVTSGSALASGDVTTALGYTPAAANAGYVNGGNTFSGNATIGLNDAYTLGFKTNNATQMTLDSTGKLGIGTAAPASKLHIYSGANADNAVSIGVAGSGNSERAKLDFLTWSDGNMLGSTSNNRGWAMTAYGNSYGTSDANDLDFSYWGGVTWTQGLRLEQTGKVGIGTSNPQYSLDFNGRTDAVRLPAGTTAQQPTAAAGLIRYNTTNSNIEFNNGSAWTALATGSGSGYVNGGNTFSGNATIGLNDAYNLSVKTNNATRMTFTGNGNIGILTTSPQAALHIADTNATGSSYSPLTIGTNAGAHVGIDFDSVQAYNGGSNSILYLNYWGGDVGLGDASKVKFDRTNSKLAFYSGGSIDVASTGTIATANGSISSAYGNIYTTNGKIGAGGVPAYSIDAGTNTDAIRIPAGTTAQRPANAAGLVRYNTTNGNVEYNNGSGWSVLATSSGASGAFVNGGNSFGAATSLGTNDGNALTLKTNGTTAMTIDTSQNLSTAGDVTMVSGKSLMFGTSAYSFVNGTGGASSYLNFGTSGAIVMTLDVNGRVGIGTNPQFSLDLGSRTDSIRLPAGTDAQRPANTAGQLRYNTTSNAVEFNNGSAWTALGSGGGSGFANGGNTFSGNATIGLNDNYNLGFKTNNTTQMTLSNAGNLGVGTASPAAKIHVKGSAPTSVTIANEYLHLGGTEQVNGGYQVIGFGYYSSEAYPNAYMGMIQTSVGGSGKGDLVFGARNSTSDVAPSELMRINSAGNVGIGTTTINNNLSFSGQSAQKVGVERITTSGTAGSDFTITAGGAYSGGTNLAGGTLTLSSGTSTGTGGSQILLQTASAGTTGTTDRAPATKVTISGTASSDAMQVAGTIRGTSVDNSSSTTIDWSKGNTQYTAAGCTGTQYTFSNMRDGGVYTLAITGTFSANCTFGQTSPDTLSGTPGSGAFYFLPANSIPSGSNAIFSFMRVGTKVYVQWNSGFQN